MMNSFLEIIFSLIIILGSFYFLGKFFTGFLKISLKFYEDIFYSGVLGILVFTLVSYLLAFTKLDQLMLPLIIGTVLIVLVKKYLPPLEIQKSHRVPILIAILLALIFSIIMLYSGAHGNNIIFRHDDPWHLALINELKVNFPPDNPGFSNIPLKGYHFFYNFLTSRLSLTFLIPTNNLHFSYLPLIFAILLAIGIYSFMYRWQKNNFTAITAVFLSLFCGSFAFILPLLGFMNVNPDNGLLMLQPILTLYNPPLAISLIIMVFFLLNIYLYFEDQSKKWLLPLILAVGLLPMFKVYGGIILYLGFIMFALINLFKKRFAPLFSLSLTALITYFTFFVFAGNSGGLKFYPLWAPHNLIESLNLYSYSTVNATGLSIFKRIGIEFIGLFLFIFGNLGIRLIGILGLLKDKHKHISEFTLIISFMGISSLLLPLLFIQTLKEFEIIQFSSYYLFIAALISAIGFKNLFDIKINKSIKLIILILLVLLSLPTAFYQYSLLARLDQNAIKLDSDYYKSINYLKNTGSYDDILLEVPPRDQLITDPQLKDWYKNYSNPNLIAFANKRGFLNNEFIDFPNVNLNYRLDIVKRVIETQRGNPKEMKKLGILLKKEGIKYLYMKSDVSEITQIPNVKRVFHNSATTIYKMADN